MNRSDLAARLHALVEMSEGLASSVRVLQRQLADLDSGQQELLGLPVQVLTSPGKSNDVVMRVAALLGSTLGEIKGPSRSLRTNRARHAAALALHRCSYSQSEIGRILGKRDHSTAANSITRAKEIEQTDRLFAKAVRRGVALGLGEVEVEE
jgi:hypothetical protein